MFYVFSHVDTYRCRVVAVGYIYGFVIMIGFVLFGDGVWLDNRTYLYYF